jgi:DNA-binding NarL/FixJ family response regulator
MPMIKVGVVGANVVVRKGISSCIGLDKLMEVLIEANGGANLLEQLEGVVLDVVVWTFDDQLDFQEYIELLQKKLNICLLLVDAYFDRKLYLQVMETKRFGYFTMRTSIEELNKAIQQVMDIDYYYDEKLPKQWREESGIECTQACFLNSFSERQLEVAKQAILGNKSLDIGKDLFISLSTVESHRSNIMQRTHCANFAEVALLFIQYGFLSVRDLGIRFLLIGWLLMMSFTIGDDWVVDDDELGNAGYEYVMTIDG